MFFQAGPLGKEKPTTKQPIQCNAMYSETHKMAGNCNSFALKLSKSEFTLSQLELGGRWELGWHSMICILVSGKISFSCNLRIQYYVGSMVNFSICFPSGALVPLTQIPESSVIFGLYFQCAFSHTHYNNYENLFFKLKI